MSTEPNPPEVAVVTVRLGVDLKRDLQECARRLDLSENTVAKHAIRAAIDYIKLMDYRRGPPFRMILDDPSPSSVDEDRRLQPEGGDSAGI
jgi:hypothetical protein